MDADLLIEHGRRRLVEVNERFGWQGDEDDQAWELLTHACGGEQPDDDDDIPPAVQKRYERILERRVSGEPIAYIVGEVEFRDFRLGIKPGMFVPRLTSEFLATQAIRRLVRRRDPVHVDLATGIGPIALSTARSVPRARVFGLDISEKAIAQARANALKLGLENVKFKKSDMFASLARGLHGRVDVVTIHPPYVARGEVSELPDEIKKFEPRHTLSDGSVDGLGLVKRAIDEGAGWIRPGGWLLIEVVASEFRNIRPMLRHSGYGGIRSTRGPLPYTRVIAGRLEAS